MLISSSRALFALEQPACKCRCLTTSALRSARMLPRRPAPALLDEETEAPILGRQRRLRQLRDEQAIQAQAEYDAARAREKRQDVWISVYLSISDRKGQGATYTGLTYDVENALRADNGEREKGILFQRRPHGVAPRSLRPFRLCVALGGFNSAAAARQFLKAWKNPALSRFLLVPGAQPRELRLGKRGLPLSYGQRTQRQLYPHSGDAFFYDSSIDLLPYKVAVLQRLCTVAPFNTMPLRVALYSNEAEAAWKAALAGDWPGGPNDSLRLPSGIESFHNERRLTCIDVQRRHPIPDGALAFLQPEMRSPSLPWNGPAGDATSQKRLRGANNMVRSLLGAGQPPRLQGKRVLEHKRLYQ